MGPDSQGNKQEFSGLRRQQPSCGHHQPSPVHLVSNASCDHSNLQMWPGQIAFVIQLQIPTQYFQYAWSTCSDMHVRLQLILGTNRDTDVEWMVWLTSHLPHSAKLIILKEQEQWVRFRRQNSIVKIPGNTDMRFIQQPWGSLAGLHEWDAMYWKMLEGPFFAKGKLCLISL